MTPVDVIQWSVAVLVAASVFGVVVALGSLLWTLVFDR